MQTHTSNRSSFFAQLSSLSVVSVGSRYVCLSLASASACLTHATILDDGNDILTVGQVADKFAMVNLVRRGEQERVSKGAHSMDRLLKLAAGPGTCDDAEGEPDGGGDRRGLWQRLRGSR